MESRQRDHIDSQVPERSGGASLVVKNMPAMWETWVRSLGGEDPLEKEMAIHSSTVAWKIPWTEEPGRLQSMWSQRVRHDSDFTFIPKEKANNLSVHVIL